MGRRRKIITVESVKPNLFGSLDIELSEEETELFIYLDGSSSLQELICRVRDILWEMGISDFAHSTLNTNCGILDPCGTYDQSYTDRYAREGFHQGDMVVKHLLTTKMPVFRSDISAHIASANYDVDFYQNHRAATEFIASCGLLDVYAIPIVGNEYFASFSISTHKLAPALFRERVMKHQTRIQLLAKFVDLIGRERFPKSFHADINPRIAVPDRALELLDIMARKDCSVGDAALLLGITVSTANKHLAKARKALETNTLWGTCIAAIREKMIAIE